MVASADALPRDMGGREVKLLSMLASGSSIQLSIDKGAPSLFQPRRRIVDHRHRVLERLCFAKETGNFLHHLISPAASHRDLARDEKQDSCGNKKRESDALNARCQHASSILSDADVVLQIADLPVFAWNSCLLTPCMFIG